MGAMHTWMTVEMFRLPPLPPQPTHTLITSSVERRGTFGRTPSRAAPGTRYVCLS